MTALVGPSGSGKSTLSKLAVRFWDADSGRILVGVVDVSAVDPETLLRDYSVLFQDVLLFDDTVTGNIRLGRCDATEAEVLAAAKAAMCDDFVRKLPQGYATLPHGRPAEPVIGLGPLGVAAQRRGARAPPINRRA